MTRLAIASFILLLYSFLDFLLNAFLFVCIQIGVPLETVSKFPYASSELYRTCSWGEQEIAFIG